ncbi:MAG: PAS domain S-box protein [Planctomycetota bacterium]
MNRPADPVHTDARPSVRRRRSHLTRGDILALGSFLAIACVVIGIELCLAWIAGFDATSIVQLAIQAVFAFFAAFLVCLTVLSRRSEVSARREKERVIESERRLQQWTDTAPMLLWATDAEGELVYLSGGWEEYIDLTDRTNLKERWLGLVVERDLERMKLACAVSHENHERLEVTVGLQRKNGEERVFIDRGVPQFDADGRFTGLIGCCVDITDHERMRSKLDTVELAIAYVEDAVLITEPDPSTGAQIIVHCNAAFERMTGYTRDEVVGRTPRFMRGPDADETVLHELDEAIRRGESFRCELRNARKSGEPYWADSTLHTVRDQHGRAARVVAIQRDITERRAHEQRLRDLNERFELAEQAARVAAFEVDLRTEIMALSPHAASLLGYPPGTTQRDVHTIMRERVHPADQWGVLKRLERAAVDPGPRHGAHRLVLPTGETRWIEVHAITHFVDQAPTRIVGLLQDVTEQREAEMRRAQLEEELRLFIEQTPAAVAMFDRDMRYLRASKGWYEQYGLGTDSIIGRSHNEVFPAITEQWNDLYKRVLNGAELASPADCLLREDGTETWIRWQLTPWRHPDGQIGGIIMYTEIINQQIANERRLQRTHQELAASEAKYRKIIEEHTELVCRFLPDCTLTFVNQSYARRFGRSADELIGTTFLDLVPEHVHESIHDRIDALSPARPEIRMDHQVILPDGTLAIQEWIDVGIFDADGRLIECQGYGRDITAIRAAEERDKRRIRQQEMLLRELNHRVKNSLGGLLTMIDLCRDVESTKEGMAESLRARVRAMLDVHTMLSESHWSPVDLREFLMRFTPPGTSDRVTITGPSAEVPAEQATAFGIVIGELFANSGEHGALSTNGRINVDWTIDPDDPVLVTLQWREHHGPALTPPTPGLGMNLIEGFARSELRGGIEFGFPPDGVAHTLTMRLDPAIIDDPRVKTTAHLENMPRAQHAS